MAKILSCLLLACVTTCVWSMSIMRTENVGPIMNSDVVIEGDRSDSVALQVNVTNEELPWGRESTNVIYGGSTSEGLWYHQKFFKVRPNSFKSTQCKFNTSSKTCMWEDCTRPDGCWHGASYNSMSIQVPANSAHQKQAVAMHAQCSKKAGSWSINPISLNNAQVAVYIDYKLYANIAVDPTGGIPYWTKRTSPPTTTLAGATTAAPTTAGPTAAPEDEGSLPFDDTSCTWTRHSNKYSAGHAGGNSTPFPSRAQAQIQCVMMGLAVCRAVTCTGSGKICTVRAASSLQTSISGETTYVPGDRCYTDRPDVADTTTVLGKWIKAWSGQNCNAACQTREMICNSDKQSTLTTNALVSDAFKQAGYTCLGPYSPRDYAGAPFSTGSSADCAPIIAGSKSSCSDNRYHHHSPLCYCDPEPPIAWVLGREGGKCKDSQSVTESLCLEASQKLLPDKETSGDGRRRRRSTLVTGSWSYAPPGCSIQNVSKVAQFNTLTSGKNQGAYTPICDVTRATPVALTIAESHAQPVHTYKHFRFIPVSLKYSFFTSVKIAEIAFQSNGTILDMTGAVATNPGGDNPTGESASRAIDGNIDTSWCDYRKGKLMVTFPSAVHIDEFRLTAASGGSTDATVNLFPVTWRLEGSNDAESWTILHEKSDYAVPAYGFSHTEWFSLTNPKWWCVARLDAQEMKGSYGNVEDAKSELNTREGKGGNRQMICEMSAIGAKTDPQTIGDDNQDQGGDGFNAWWEGPSDIIAMNQMCNNGNACKSAPISGLNEAWYAVSYISSMPDFNKLTPSSRRSVKNINYAGTSSAWPGYTKQDHFAVLWTGSISITYSGTYTFSLKSDDGSMLFISTATVIDNDGVRSSLQEISASHDGLHDPDMQERTGTKALTSGNFGLRVMFFESTGTGGCIFKYKGPDTDGQLVVVPETVLKLVYPDSEAEAAVKYSEERYPTYYTRRRRSETLEGGGIARRRYVAPQKLHVPITGSSKSHLKVIFRAIDPTKPSSANVRLVAASITQSTDNCMAVKNCLDGLLDDEDVGDEGYEIRDANEKQLDCLEEPDTLVTLTKCKKWKQCVPAEQRQVLKALLKASISKPVKKLDAAGTWTGKYDWKRKAVWSSMLGRESGLTSAAVATKRTVLADDNNAQQWEDDACIDPGTDDPESWDCDCLDAMKVSCGGLEPECLKGLMCNFAWVCKDWKDEHCDDSADLLQGSNVLARRAAREKTKGISTNDLDNSVTGKCVM